MSIENVTPFQNEEELEMNDINQENVNEPEEETEDTTDDEETEDENEQEETDAE